MYKSNYINNEKSFLILFLKCLIQCLLTVWLFVGVFFSIQGVSYKSLA